MISETTEITIMFVMASMAYVAIHYATRKPVWEREGYGARRCHAVSAIEQGLPYQVQDRRPIAHELPNDKASWGDAELAQMIYGAKVDAADAARVPVAVCIMTKSQIEDLDWAAAWRRVDDILEACTREMDRALTYRQPHTMATYWENQRRDAAHRDAARAGNTAEILRQDTKTLDIMFREIDAHLAAAEQLQAA